MLVASLALTLALQAAVPRVMSEPYPDGTPHLEYEVVESKGKLQKHGAFREWHPNGALKAEGRYERDLAASAWTFYDEGGRPRESGRFSKGERVGAWTELWPDGTKRAQGKYAKGRRDGRWSAWNADGSPDAAATGEWRFDSTVWADGAPREAGHTCNGARQGAWTGHAQDGSLAWEGEFRAGRRHGAWRFQRRDGSRHSDGAYVDGLADGEWTSYWEDGRPAVRGRYAAGKRDGEWSFELPDGRPVRFTIAGTYAEGRRTGPLAAGATLAPDSLENLGALPAPRGSADASELVAARVRELCVAAASADPDVYQPAFEGLTFYGRAAMPVVLDALRSVKLDTPQGAALADRFDGLFFRRTWIGESFPLPRGARPADAQGRLEWWRAWYALWAATRDAHSWWEIDLGAEPRANERRDELARRLSEPPVFEPDFATLAPAEPPPRLALRFRAHDGSPRTLEAVRDGLAWLAAHQHANGWWDTRAFPDLCGRIGKSRCDGVVERQHFVGVTALALACFLAEGNTPEHGPYAPVVSRAVAAILRAQFAKNGSFSAPFTRRDETGLLGEYRWMEWVYEHTLALQALSDTLAVSEHPVLRRRLERAVETSLAMRAPHGGWGYHLPNDGHCDSSVTAWQLASLRSATWAGLAVPDEAFAGGLAWLDSMTDRDTGRTGYVTLGSIGARVPNVNDQYPCAVETLTGGALLARLWSGAASDDELVARQARLIAASLPRADSLALATDAYGWMWCSLGMRELDDAALWPGWRAALEETVCSLQRLDGDAKGSWDPFGPWAYKFGRIGNTALCILALQSPWRYAPEPRGGVRAPPPRR